MGGLSSFLAQNALKVESVKYVASKRFLDADGQPIAWEIVCITSTEDEALKTASNKRVQVPGKRHVYVPEVDYPLYTGRLAAKCTKYPNLNDAELQGSYGVMGADALLKAMLTPGEYADYLVKVQEINGFDVPFAEKVEEAKNS